MVRLNLSSDDVRNCKETTTFVKKRNLSLACKQELSIEKSKKLDKFRESKTRRSVIKVSKTQNDNDFK